MFPIVVAALAGLDPMVVLPPTIENYQAATADLQRETDELIVSGMAHLLRAGRAVPVAGMRMLRDDRSPEGETIAAARALRGLAETAGTIPDPRLERQQALARATAQVAKADASVKGLEVETRALGGDPAKAAELEAARGRLALAKSARQDAQLDRDWLLLTEPGMPLRRPAPAIWGEPPSVALARQNHAAMLAARTDARRALAALAALPAAK